MLYRKMSHRRVETASNTTVETKTVNRLKQNKRNLKYFGVELQSIVHIGQFTNLSFWLKHHKASEVIEVIDILLG